MTEMDDKRDAISAAIESARQTADYVFVEFTALTGVGMQLKPSGCELVALLSEQRLPANEGHVRQTMADLELAPKIDTVDDDGMLMLIYELPLYEWKTAGVFFYLLEKCFELTGHKRVKFYSMRFEYGTNRD